MFLSFPPHFLDATIVLRISPFSFYYSRSSSLIIWWLVDCFFLVLHQPGFTGSCRPARPWQWPPADWRSAPRRPCRPRLGCRACGRRPWAGRKYSPLASRQSCSHLEKTRRRISQQCQVSIVVLGQVKQIEEEEKEMRIFRGYRVVHIRVVVVVLVVVIGDHSQYNWALYRAAFCCIKTVSKSCFKGWPSLWSRVLRSMGSSWQN